MVVSWIWHLLILSPSQAAFLKGHDHPFSCCHCHSYQASSCSCLWEILAADHHLQPQHLSSSHHCLSTMLWLHLSWVLLLEALGQQKCCFPSMEQQGCCLSSLVWMQVLLCPAFLSILLELPWASGCTCLPASTTPLSPSSIQ